MFIHDVIKVQFVNIGYLPNRPYHLISDKEMFDAFIWNEESFFGDYYPCPGDSLVEQYNTLKTAIQNLIQIHLEDPLTPVPNWVYSYMLLQTITYESSLEDIYYIYDLLGLDSSQGLPKFDEEVAAECYRASEEWLKRLPSKQTERPPTMFGEPHIVKSLRLQQANVLIDGE